MPDNPVPIEIFCFYSIEDKDSFKRLKVHLKPLLRLEHIAFSTNHPREAGLPGVDEHKYITEHLANAALVLLLISPDFLAYDDVSSLEIERVMQRRRANQVLVVPILVKPGDWKDELFAPFSVLPSNGKYIVQWGNSDEAFLNVVNGLRRVLKGLPDSISPFPPVPPPIESSQEIQPVSPSSAFLNVATPSLSVTAAERIKAKRAAKTFDVFLCHHESDKPAVRQISQQLKAQGVLPWFDEDELPPGAFWQELLDQQISQIKTAAVFVGKSGIGPWQEQTLYAFLRQFVYRRCPVIPVLLPDAGQEPAFPPSLSAMTWVDFRQSDPAPLPRLIWGITGERPENW